MILTETEDGRVLVTSKAIIIDDTTEKAWAEKYIRDNEFYAWILGKYVAADEANLNRQYFPLDQLREHARTLDYAPLNIGHEPPMVGTYAASEMLYPIEGASEENPFLEALSVMWKGHFPEEFADVDKAYKSGKLAYSMETRPTHVTCGGDAGCQETFDYVGRTSETYCAHVNRPSDDMAKVFTNPRFTGGALILPPLRPGWSRADVTQMAALEEEVAESTYESIKADFPELDAKAWEEMMVNLHTRYSTRH